MTGVFSMAVSVEQILRGALQEPIPVSVTSLVLRTLHGAVEERDAGAEIRIEAVAGEVQHADIVGPAVAHAFEIDRGTVGAAGAWIGVVVKSDGESGDAGVLVHGAVGESDLNRVIGRIEF